METPDEIVKNPPDSTDLLRLSSAEPSYTPEMLAVLDNGSGIPRTREFLYCIDYGVPIYR